MTSDKVDSRVEIARLQEAERRKFAETMAELRESVLDMEARQGRPLADVAADIRRKFSIPAGNE